MAVGFKFVTNEAQWSCCFQPCLYEFCFLPVVDCWLSDFGFGCRVRCICRWQLLVVGFRLSCVDCRVLTFDCRMSLSVVVVGAITCRVLVVDCCYHSPFPLSVPSFEKYPHSKKIPQRMLSSWLLHRRHIHLGNTSTVNDKMYCLCD
jgi:hypothetical protein